MAAAEFLTAPAYRLGHLLLGGAARVYFSSIEVRHRERVPRHGAVLVVSNHPATFADVIVLGSAIPRRLHFLAMAPIFKPWIRGAALRLGGALPVYRRQDDASLMGKNEDTFRACHDILDQGGAVLIFPEGESLTDRQVVPIKTGAARIALGQEARPGQAERLTLLPAGLHFAERTRFRSEVVATVGRPIVLAPYRELALTDPAEAVRALTDEIQRVLEKLIVNVPDESRAALVDSVERLYRDDARGGEAGVALARGVAQCVEHFARVDPRRIESVRARMRRYERQLDALEVGDRAVREMLPPGGRALPRLRLLTLGALGLVPALAGGLFHFVPYKLTGAIGGRVTREPSQVAAARIAVGVVLYPLAYGALAFFLWRGLDWSARAIAIAIVVVALLGLHALGYFTWLRHQRQRIRLVLLSIGRGRQVDQVRRERRELIRLFDQAQRDYAAARPGG